ncbi:defensin-like protein 1 [Cornus florida]|uniref:defensin-like protein 1 n=1 Tax=Cornus florida TaxID=4283 RepID=UPI0028A0E3EE|nr:defensin-like protein 1 [Cornus florida]
MARNTSFAKFFLIFLICLLLANSEFNSIDVIIYTELVAAKVCKRRSKTWYGVCIWSSHCDNQCRKWEKAKHGGCHGTACYCYFCD